MPSTVCEGNRLRTTARSDGSESVNGRQRCQRAADDIQTTASNLSPSFVQRLSGGASRLAALLLLRHSRYPRSSRLAIPVARFEIHCTTDADRPLSNGRGGG